MSLNLTCEGIELWQTPTHITEICLSYNPKTGKSDGGNEGVRRRYLLWVASSLNGVWSNPEELQNQRARVFEHAKQVRALKRPRFSFI